MTARWIEQARSLTQSSSIPLGVPVATHMDMLLRYTRRDLRVACDALEAVLEFATAERDKISRTYISQPDTAYAGYANAMDDVIRTIETALGIETGADDD